MVFLRSKTQHESKNRYNYRPALVLSRSHVRAVFGAGISFLFASLTEFSEEMCAKAHVSAMSNVLQPPSVDDASPPLDIVCNIPHISDSWLTWHMDFFKELEHVFHVDPKASFAIRRSEKSRPFSTREPNPLVVPKE